MAEPKKPKGEYEVGYCKPPKRSQFVPGQSGNKGHKKKRSPTTQEIVANARDAVVTVGGVEMSKFQLAIESTFNQTIKGGKPRDLKVLMELMRDYGGLTAGDLAAEMEAGAKEVQDKIWAYFLRERQIDPADVELHKTFQAQEIAVVMGCSCCAPDLRRLWSNPVYKGVAERYGQTAIHKVAVKDAEQRSEANG